MNGGDNSDRYRFQTLPRGPVSVKREAEEDGEEAAVGQAFTIRSSSPSVLPSVDVAGAESASSVDQGEQEEALAALVEFRSKEVERLRQRLEYYKSQVSASSLAVGPPTLSSESPRPCPALPPPPSCLLLFIDLFLCICDSELTATTCIWWWWRMAMVLGVVVVVLCCLGSSKMQRGN